MAVRDELIRDLFENRDEKYRDFQSGLIPGVDKELFIGVRTPVLRKLAGKYAAREDIDEFLDTLPHHYFDENQMHSFIISLEKDFDECIKRVDGFLPHVNNWATCDQMSPKVFRKNHDRLVSHALRWLGGKDTYTIRFGALMLMQHFLDDDYKWEYMNVVGSIRSDEYYVNMMVAWYFATAMAKQRDDAVRYIEDRKLPEWTHNKAIQKAVESRRIDDETKAYLRTLKIRKS